MVVCRPHFAHARTLQWYNRPLFLLDLRRLGNVLHSCSWHRILLFECPYYHRYKMENDEVEGAEARNGDRIENIALRNIPPNCVLELGVLILALLGVLLQKRRRRSSIRMVTPTGRQGPSLEGSL